MSHRHCFALDLLDDCEAVEAYEAWHRPGETPARVIAFFRDQGVEDLQIYRAGNRLFMIPDLRDDVSAADFTSAGCRDRDMQAWAKNMAAYQRPIAFGSVAVSPPSPDWVAMGELFNLKDHP